MEIKKMNIVKKLFLAYIGLVVLFNAITIGTVTHPRLQLLVSLIVIAFMLLLVFQMHTRMRVVWWATFLFTIIGILRPFIEYMFSRYVPYIAETFYPPFTPLFAIIGFIIMCVCFGILTDRQIQDYFDVHERF